ncbi:MAG: YkgJ family cysteine cluster protein [Bdellovibrionaceae bacterium]|nr:YkgJ family cysteine cluster protein [Pseudobdellovibrionaceae bacterium]
MSYYKRLLTEISVTESAVDCGKCSDLYKCCTYKPFIANFLCGEMDEKLLAFDLSDWDFTICGIAPSLKYRKKFKGRSGWGFGTDATLLCSFYDKKSGGCNVWQSRPGVCRTFFCKSTYQDGQAYWKSAEELTWMMEWILLEDFLLEEGWLEEEIAGVKAYLHENAIDKKVICPEGSLFANIKDAMVFYKKATLHVQTLSTDYIQELLGQNGLIKREQVLAQKQNLR